MSMNQKYLVTGASGFVAMHVVDQLLKQGHYVRGTIRNLNDTKKVSALKKLGPIELVEADLLDVDSLKRAAKGIDVVLHVASPVPPNHCGDEDAVVKPAKEGTLNMLKAAVEENVKRVVLTSSGFAIYNYSFENDHVCEKDWASVEKVNSVYQKSKILAERAAWDFVAERKQKNLPCFAFSTVNPVWVLGPPLSSDHTASVTRMTQIMSKSTDQIENLISTVCDVRDVAAAHIRSAQTDEAVGERILVVSRSKLVTTMELVDMLREAGYSVASVVGGDQDFAKVDRVFMDNSKLRNILKINPIDFKKTVLDMAKSLVELGIVKQD